MSAVDWSRVSVALSVRQPWAWLICHGHKDVENRRWATNFRGPALIHAAGRWGKEEQEDAEIVREAFGIVFPKKFELGGIVGGAEFVDCVTTFSSPWFCGPYGFVLRNATPLPFRRLPGRLGFFSVATGLPSHEAPQLYPEMTKLYPGAFE